jgi:3-dehydroquinate synthase
VALPTGRGCEIVVGSGASEEAPGLLRSLQVSRIAVIADASVASIHGVRIVSLLKSAGLDHVLLSFPPGERSKTRSTKEDLEDQMIASGLSRDAAVLSLGGGVTCDLAGFVAATYMRGIPIVHAPTSLLAMADASIGGKTGVDHPAGKNLIGAFHHPAAVLADTRFLATLPDREYRTGLAEMIKAGIVADAGLFDLMEARAGDLAARDPGLIEDLLPRAMSVKVSIVEKDDRESGLRKVLNFGHTLGHALELESGYSLAHGEAISIGMVVEAAMAVRLGLLPPEAADRIGRLLERAGLPVRLPPESVPSRVIQLAVTDKKSRRGRIEFVLPERVGAVAMTGTGPSRWVPDAIVSASLEDYRSGG